MSSTKMSLLRRAFRNVFTARKRKYTAEAKESCEKYTNPGPGWVGSNLPFQTDNLPMFLCGYILYFASGFGIPFFGLRYLTLKNK